eukprot:CAMPEP_0114997140 /NCGR_PEP_ID=MMETSP0216-20121206/14731_1 /TAXON_ID=223996 /ORGANISM="Protocruzia adherens, Strain Boccale" /LENGTH=71 /DNA_ID=CAMNT_0002361483 /DNA_START=1091 /DNA_END=1306 /DNA_ORIENTATION=+
MKREETHKETTSQKYHKKKKDTTRKSKMWSLKRKMRVATESNVGINEAMEIERAKHPNCYLDVLQFIAEKI